MEIKTLNDVKRLMSDNETDSVEYKATTGQLERGMETLCAFLNGSGGSVLFGITDKGQINGQECGRCKAQSPVLLQRKSLCAGGKHDDRHVTSHI